MEKLFTYKEIVEFLIKHDGVSFLEDSKRFKIVDHRGDALSDWFDCPYKAIFQAMKGY